MKKLFDAIVVLLAVNFLAIAGGVGWLYQSGRLDHKRVGAIKEVLFPPSPTEAPATQPATPEARPAAQRLQELLARHAGRSAAEQVDFIQQTFDATTVQLDRREREVTDRERQVSTANAKLAEDRKTLEAERQRLTDQERQADRLAGDKGFQDTLSLYNTMTGKQVKGVFMTMDEALAAQYLDAMTPRAAAKILKEFKLPDEADRMKRILEKMRHPPGVVGPSTQEARE